MPVSVGIWNSTIFHSNVYRILMQLLSEHYLFAYVPASRFGQLPSHGRMGLRSSNFATRAWSQFHRYKWSDQCEITKTVSKNKTNKQMSSKPRIQLSICAGRWTWSLHCGNQSLWIVLWHWPCFVARQNIVKINFPFLPLALDLVAAPASQT